MRIISVRLEPVARVFASVYAVFGLIAWVVYALGTVDYFTLPLGIMAPLFHLNLNVNLARSRGVLYNIFLCVSSVISYGLTGWMTGIVGAFLFNVIARRMGGVDAKYVITAGDDTSRKSAVEQGTHLP